MQSSSLSHSESDVKLDISDFQQNNFKLDVESEEPQITCKRFSILDDNVDELNRNFYKLDNQSKAKRLSEDVLRKTLELTCEYNQSGDRILKLNLHDRDQAAVSEVTPFKQIQSPPPPPPEPVGKKITSQRYGDQQTNKETKSRQSKPPSCQTVVINQPNMYKTTKKLNLLAQPQPRIPSNFSNHLYKNYNTAQTEDKQNVEYNLFTKAIQTERQKDKQTFCSYLKRHR